MTADFEVTGADQFLALSKALKAAGRSGMRAELNRAMRDAAKPLIEKTRAAALADLPTRGGLAAQVAREPQRVQTRTGRDPGVRLVVTRRRGGAAAANRGMIRHPVFADGSKTRQQWAWVDQPVRPGWFDKTITNEAPAIRRDLEQALETVARRIVEEGRRG